MIFNVPGHIELIRNGLHMDLAIEKAGIRMAVVKTQTRRLNGGVYRVGKDYAVQRKRGTKAERDIRIMIDDIREERQWLPSGTICFSDAQAEGGYTPEQYEVLFKKANPKWKWYQPRWAFFFHVIEVQKNVPASGHAREERVTRRRFQLRPPMQTARCPRL